MTQNQKIDAVAKHIGDALQASAEQCDPNMLETVTALLMTVLILCKAHVEKPPPELQKLLDQARLIVDIVIGNYRAEDLN